MKPRKQKSTKSLNNGRFVNKLKKDPEFKAEYDALAPEFDLLEKMLKTRSSL